MKPARRIRQTLATPSNKDRHHPRWGTTQLSGRAEVLSLRGGSNSVPSQGSRTQTSISGAPGRNTGGLVVAPDSRLRSASTPLSSGPQLPGGGDPFDQRVSRAFEFVALFRQLGSDPAQFAELVILGYRLLTADSAAG